MAIKVYTSSDKVRVDFQMSYATFTYLRQRIAMLLDKKFGKKYLEMENCKTREDFLKLDMALNKIQADWSYKMRKVSSFVLTGMWEEETIRPKDSKELYELLENLNEEWLLSCSGKQFYLSDFKKLLYDCIKYNVNWYWS